MEEMAPEMLAAERKLVALAEAQEACSLGSRWVSIHRPTPDVLAYAVRHGVETATKNFTTWDLQFGDTLITVYAPTNTEK